MTDVKGKDLQLALRGIGPEIQTMMEEALGRSVEFVLIALEEDAQGVAVGYLANTKTNMHETLVRAQASLNVILTQNPSPNHPINLH